jgi:hypothetical protein
MSNGQKGQPADPLGKARSPRRVEMLAPLARTVAVLAFLAAVALFLGYGWDGWVNLPAANKARAAAVFLVLALLFPLCQFLLFGWHVRREEVLALFPPKAILLYYETYFPAELKRYAAEKAVRLKDANGDAARYREEEAAIKADFRAHFDRRYGRVHYALPIALLVLVGATLALLCARFLLENPPSDGMMKEHGAEVTVIICLAGAYCWVLYDFLSRERSLDFSTTHVYWASFRLIVSVPLAYAIPSLWGSEARVAVAFLLGVFPTGRLMTLLRRRAGQSPLGQTLGGTDPADDRLSRLETLPSVDTSTADRFREEGITTIAQLANADPVALTIRSGFPVSFVFDCLSEAIAWYYLQKEGLDVARTCSIPGALEVYGLIDELDYAADPANPLNGRYLEDKRLADEVINRIEAQLKCGRAVLERNLRCIWDDSRVEFLARLMDAIHEQPVEQTPPSNDSPRLGSATAPATPPGTAATTLSTDSPGLSSATPPATLPAPAPPSDGGNSPPSGGNRD